MGSGIVDLSGVKLSGNVRSSEAPRCSESHQVPPGQGALPLGTQRVGLNKRKGPSMDSESQVPDGGWGLQFTVVAEGSYSCWFVATCSVCWGAPMPEGQETCQLSGSHPWLYHQDRMDAGQPLKAGLGPAGMWGGYVGLSAGIAGQEQGCGSKPPSRVLAQQKTSPSQSPLPRTILAPSPVSPPPTQVG